MSVLSIVLLVLFIIVCMLLIFLILLQNEEGDSIGGLFAGSSNSAFGAKSSSILTKLTQGGLVLFFVLVVSLAFTHRTKISDIEVDVKEQQLEQSKEWWKDGEKQESGQPSEEGSSDTETVNPENSEKTE